MADNQKPVYGSVTNEMLDRAFRKAMGVRKSEANDADTVYGGTSQDGRTGVRFLGIDALEKDQGKEGQVAAEWAKRELDGRDLGAEGGAIDAKGRRVQTVFTKDGKPFNVEAVRQGHAIVYRDYLDGVSPEMQQMLVQAEDEAKAAKRGYWSNPELETPEKFRLRKKIRDFKTGKSSEDPFKPVGQERYQEPETWLGQALEPVDRLRNAVASAGYGALKAPWGHKLESAAKSAVQGLKGERQTTGTMLKDRATGELGFGKVRLGRDDGKFQVGDVLDHGLDFGVDIVTDPLMAVGSVAKAVRGSEAFGKLAPNLAKGIRDLEVSKATGTELTKEALQARKVLDRTRVATGAALGAGTQGGEDAEGDQFLGALLGGVATAAGIKLGRHAAPAVREKFDNIYDSYARRTGKLGTAPDDVKEIVRLRRDQHAWSKAIAEGAEADLRSQGRWFKPGQSVADQRLVQEELEALKVAKEGEALAKVNGYLKEEAQRQLDRSGKKFATAEEHAEALQKKAQLIQDVVVADGSLSKAMRSSREGLQKVRFIATEISQGRYQVLDGLNEAEKVLVHDVMRMGKEETKRFREELFRAEQFDPDMMMGPELRRRVTTGELSEGEKKILLDSYQGELSRELDKLHAKVQQTRDPLELAKLGNERSQLVDRQIRFEHGLNEGFVHPYQVNRATGLLNEHAQNRMNELTELANKRADAYMARQLPKVASKQAREAALSWVDGNKALMDRYNQEVLKVPFGPSKPSSMGQVNEGVRGLNWHVEDVYAHEDLLQAEEVFTLVKDSRLKAARAEGGSDVASEIGRDNTHALYAKNMAYKFVDKQTKEAMRLVRGYHEMLAANKYVRGFDKVLGMFDRMQNFAKANMLYFSTSWMKNNYFDNLAKAWIEGGYGNMVAVGGSAKGVIPKLRKELGRDLGDIASGKLSRKFHDDEILEAMNHGVLDALAFDTLLNHDELQVALKDSRSYKKFIEGAPEDPKGLLSSFADWWTGGLSKTVGSMGNYIESSARMLTYKNVKQQMLALGHKEDVAMKGAAKVVKETFFDYGDVTAFENAVFKRIIPFYSFYAKNLPYWCKAVTDPVKLGRVAGIEHLRQNVGDDLRPGEAEKLQPYIKENNPRRLGTDDRGNLLFSITPAGSMDDAIKMLNPKSLAGVAIEKTSPLLKLPYELISGHDLFTDTDLYPSDTAKNKKYLYSRGFKLVVMQKLLEKAGMDAQALGIGVDDKGNPYATTDNVVKIDRILSTVFPQGALEQIAGSVGKVQHDKESVAQALINRLSPIQQVSVSEQNMRATRERREKKRGE